MDIVGDSSGTWLSRAPLVDADDADDDDDVADEDDDEDDDGVFDCVKLVKCGINIGDIRPGVSKPELADPAPGNDSFSTLESPTTT